MQQQHEEADEGAALAVSLEESAAACSGQNLGGGGRQQNKGPDENRTPHRELPAATQTELFNKNIPQINRLIFMCECFSADLLQDGCVQRSADQEPGVIVASDL